MPLCAFSKIRVPRRNAVLGRLLHRLASCSLMFSYVQSGMRCNVVQIVYRLSQSAFLSTLFLSVKYLCLCCWRVCFYHIQICISRHSVLSLESTFHTDWNVVRCSLDALECVNILFNTFHFVLQKALFIPIYRFCQLTFEKNPWWIGYDNVPATNTAVICWLLSVAFCFAKYFPFTLVLIPFSHQPKCLQSYRQRPSA